MQYSEVAIGDGSVIFDVSGAFFPICPADESYSRKFYSDTAGTMGLIISPISLKKNEVTGKYDEAAGDTGDPGNIIDAIDAFVNTSAILQKQFKQKSNEAFTSRKRFKADFFSAIATHSAACS